MKIFTIKFIAKIFIFIAKIDLSRVFRTAAMNKVWIATELSLSFSKLPPIEINRQSKLRNYREDNADALSQWIAVMIVCEVVERLYFFRGLFFIFFSHFYSLMDV